MRAHQPHDAGGAGKLSRLLDRLHEEALEVFREPEQEHYFSHPIFARIWGEWQDWQNGIPPGREWKARGAQNPRLLEAFRVLSAAQGQAEMEERSDAESRAHGLRQAQEFRKRVMG